MDVVADWSRSLELTVVYSQQISSPEHSELVEYDARYTSLGYIWPVSLINHPSSLCTKEVHVLMYIRL